MYFAGYNQPAPQHIRGEGKEIFVVAAAKRTHEEHMQHGRAVEEGTETVEESRNKGVSCISKFLPYFDVTKGFLIPMAHGCLLGVAKSFLNTVLADYKQESEREDYVITKADRRKMVERQGEVVWTHEHGRPCKCVVKHRGSFTMEELLQSSSVYILRGCLKPELEKAWLHLRTAILHYCKIADDSLDMDKRVGAREDALHYAKIVEWVRSIGRFSGRSLFMDHFVSESGESFLYSKRLCGLEGKASLEKGHSRYGSYRHPNIYRGLLEVSRRKLLSAKRVLPEVHIGF
jgi:hypothetical protein